MNRSTYEEDLAKALTILAYRACDAHAAVYRAMCSSPEEAYAACQDGGYLHDAVHRCLPSQCLTEGVVALAARFNEETQRHIDELGERALRAEEALEEYKRNHRSPVLRVLNAVVDLCFPMHRETSNRGTFY